jgi:hypothetical protein
VSIACDFCPSLPARFVLPHADGCRVLHSHRAVYTGTAMQCVRRKRPTIMLISSTTDTAIFMRVTSKKRCCQPSRQSRENHPCCRSSQSAGRITSSSSARCGSSSFTSFVTPHHPCHPTLTGCMPGYKSNSVVHACRVWVRVLGGGTRKRTERSQESENRLFCPGPILYQAHQWAPSQSCW